MRCRPSYKSVYDRIERAYWRMREGGRADTPTRHEMAATVARTLEGLIRELAPECEDSLKVALSFVAREIHGTPQHLLEAKIEDLYREAYSSGSNQVLAYTAILASEQRALQRLTA